MLAKKLYHQLFDYDHGMHPSNSSYSVSLSSFHHIEADPTKVVPTVNIVIDDLLKEFGGNSKAP